MNDWLRTARQSKNSHFDMVCNERGIVIRTLRITLLSDSGYALTGYEY